MKTQDSFRQGQGRWGLLVILSLGMVLVPSLAAWADKPAKTGDPNIDAFVTAWLAVWSGKPPGAEAPKKTPQAFYAEEEDAKAEPDQIAGQEVTWLTDYNTARKEAIAKKKPLFLFFFKVGDNDAMQFESCILKDPEIVRVLNGCFVSLQLKAEEHTSLTKALCVDTYPTIILAAPDGDILDTIAGSVEVSRFREKLDAAVQNLPSSISPLP